MVPIYVKLVADKWKPCFGFSRQLIVGESRETRNLIMFWGVFMFHMIALAHPYVRAEKMQTKNAHLRAQSMKIFYFKLFAFSVSKIFLYIERFYRFW